MGIHGFQTIFTILSGKSLTKIEQDYYSNKSVLLLIDANCLIHIVCDEIVSSFDKSFEDRSQLYSQIYEAVYNKVINLKKTYNASSLFITFDGIPPLGKIIEQRNRKFGREYEKKFVSFLSKKFGFEYNHVDKSHIWNKCLLAPHSVFMVGLYKYFEKVFDLNMTFENDQHIKVNSNQSVLMIDGLIDGEGEHKIISFMRKYKNHDLFAKNKSVIYSPDGDMIILGLIVFSQTGIDADILIDGIDYKTNEKIMNCVNMAKFSEQVNDEIFEKKNKYFAEYFFLITLCFGNDFLPQLCFAKRTHFIHKKYFGGKLFNFWNICSQLAKFMPETEPFVNGEISRDVLKKLIYSFSQIEKLYCENKEPPKDFNEENQGLTIDSVLKDINNIASKNFDVPKIVALFEGHSYNSLHYSYMSARSVDRLKLVSESIEDKYGLCYDYKVDSYLSMICWIVKYYFGFEFNWGIAYQNVLPPMMYECYDFLCVEEKKLSQKTHFSKIDHQAALLLTTPPSKLNHPDLQVDKNLLKLFCENDLIFDDDATIPKKMFHGCKRMYEGKLCFPHISLEKVGQVISKNK